MLSLIVATLGRTQQLERLLASLADDNADDVEIIVVDQNAGDELAPVLASFAQLPMRHVRSKPGLSRARNAGLAVARGDLIGFPDDDCWYGPGTVREVHRLFDAYPDVGAIVGRTCDAAGVESVSRHLGVCCDVQPRDVFRAGNSNGLFVRRAVIEKVGGFDKTLGVGAPFGSGEETDFLLRVLSAGIRVRHEPGLVVFHEQVQTSVDRVRRYAPGFGRVRRLHGLGLPMREVLRAGGGALRAVVIAEFSGAQQRAAWVSGVMKGYSAALPRRIKGGERDRVLGLRFSQKTREALVFAVLNERIPAGEGPRLLVTANVDHIVQLRRRADFRDAYASAWSLTADGMPVYAYARARGLRALERITGCELLRDVMAGLSPQRQRCFFVVASREAARRLDGLLQARGFTSGTYTIEVPPSGFERLPRYCAELAGRIGAFRPTHLVLGVGAPKSEVFAHRFRGVLGDCYVLCVGSAVDVVTGVKSRAPAVMQRAGLEWLWRFAREPLRLFPRYFVSSWGFLRVVWADLSKS